MEILCTAARRLQQLFGSPLDDLAIAAGLIRRRRKFDAAVLLKMLVLTVLKKPDPRPSDLKRMASQLGVHASKAAVVGRFSDRLAAFLRGVLERAIGRIVAGEPAAITLLEGFTAVFIGDATTVTLPDRYAEQFPGCGGTAGSGRAAMKIQVLWDLLSGALRRMVIEPGKSSDSLSPIAREALPPGSLSLFDLGYFDLDRFRRLIDAGVFWISRLQFRATVYDTDGRKLSLLDELQRRFEAGESRIDMPILLGAMHRLPCRLIAVRIPQEVAARRRQQAHRKASKHGRAASAEQLRWQDWTIFVTNCEPERLAWKAIVILYRVRWQIELMFKIWKSIIGLTAHRPEASAQEQLSLIYAKLVAAIVQNWVLVSTTWSNGRRSLMKAAVTLRDWITTIAEALDDTERLIQVLSRLAKALEGDCVEPRRKRPSNFQLLEDQELLDWST
jgi:Transposase DDE domain